MKNSDKINQFFVQRLSDDTPGDDGWNMPSDDIFESAKVHFPKKKKKKRPFFLWLTSGVIAVGIIALIYIGLGENSQEINNSQTIVQTTTETTLGNNNTSNNTITETNNNTNTVAENNYSNLTEESKTTSKLTTIKEENASFLKNATAHWKTPKTELTTPAIETTTIKAFPFNVNVNSNTNIATPKNVIPNKSMDNLMVNQTGNSLHNNSLPFLIKKEKLEVIQSISIDENDSSLSLEKLELPSERKFQRWEIGMTHARFMLPFNVLTLTNGAEQISFDAKNVNVNIPITRRFNRKWSMTSGYSYTDLDLDLVLREELIYNQNATEDKIESKLDEIISKGVVAGSIELNDQTRDINLEFIENLELMDGDILTLNAVVPLRLNVHQMPVLVNYHIGTKKWEWIFHAGTALEYFDVSVPFLKMDAMNYNTILTNPVEFESIRTRAFTYAIIAGGGLKYHLSDHFNIGLNTKIDLTGIPFARYEFGLFYGFTPKNNNKSMMQY